MHKNTAPLLLIAILTVGLTIGACTSNVSGSQSSSRIKVFLLAGQSNMDGRGDGSKLTAHDQARVAAVRDRVKLAYNHREVVPLGPTTPQPFVAEKFGIVQSFGPELFFGLTVAEAWPDSEILLIKRSVPSASLHGAWNPNWSLERAELMHEAKDPKLYTDFLQHIRSTLAAIDNDDYELAGMLWVQGESDSNVWKFGSVPAESYGENLRNLIASIRKDTQSPDLPFFMLQVSRGEVATGMQRTAESMDNVFYLPQSFDPNSPQFLSRYDPPLGHYDYEGTKRIGTLFGEAVLGHH